MRGIKKAGLHITGFPSRYRQPGRFNCNVVYLSNPEALRPPIARGLPFRDINTSRVKEHYSSSINSLKIFLAIIVYNTRITNM